MRKIFYIGIFSLLVSSCAVMPENKSENIFEKIPVGPQEQNTPQENEILSKDYQVAKKALDKAVRENDLETIRLGLKGNSYQIKKDVVSVIVKLNDKRFVPDLIDALENNQGALSGNEVAVLQADLSDAIISAIELFIGVKFTYTLDPSKIPVMDEEDDVERIIRLSRSWWLANKKNYKPFKNEPSFGAEPSIFQYIVNSDYVVVAIPDNSHYIGKVEKKAGYDLAEMVAAVIYSFRIEKVLSSKYSTADRSQINPLQDFQLFVPVGTQGENYKKAQRYLLFLKQIPEEEKLSSVYEIEKDKTYFRVYEGEKSIFPSEGGGMHGPPTKGIIDMSNPKHLDLIQKIETFCLALNETELKTKLLKLGSLSKSADEETKTNAVYAIKVLQSPD